MALGRKIAAWTTRAWLSSLRWENHLHPSRGPSIFCVWHRDVPAAGAFLRNLEVTSLVSRSGDGHFLVDVLSGRKMRFARGSDSEGAVGGAKALIDVLRSGGSVATTWDGPRGPEGIPKPGPAWLSRRSGAPLVELEFRYGRHFRLGDWSRMRVPLPFSRISVGSS